MYSPVKTFEGSEKIMALKKIKLGEIADILPGVPDARQFEKGSNTGLTAHNFIQPNHLGAFNDIHSTSEIKRSTSANDRYFVRKNDILLKRLNPDMATLITEEMSNTVFSSNLFVIRVIKDCYPAYIACLLENQGMTWLNSNIVGSLAAIKSLSAKSLAELDIPAIDCDKQKAIGQMWLLYKKRKKLLESMIVADQRLMTALINSTTADAKEEQ
jgi:hypothetical protein